MQRYISRLVTSLFAMGVTLSVPTPSFAQTSNQVAGTWQIVSAQADRNGTISEPYGPDPEGLLIFTEDLHFTVVISKPDVPKFASGKRETGTEAENKAAMAGGLGLCGTYTVDEQGSFSGEHVIGSTFPNWNGLDRDRSRITETVEGDTMTEHLQDPSGPKITIIWQRVRRSSAAR